MDPSTYLKIWIKSEGPCLGLPVLWQVDRRIPGVYLDATLAPVSVRRVEQAMMGQDT